jgi:hypothetical protein
MDVATMREASAMTFWERFKRWLHPAPPPIKADAAARGRAAQASGYKRRPKKPPPSRP